MKYLAFLLILFSACNSNKTTSENQVPIDIIKAPIETHNCPVPIVIHDTIPLEIFSVKKYDSLLGIIKKKNDSLFVERYRLERVKFYNNIVRKNKTQLKFLSGWINRAVQ